MPRTLLSILAIALVLVGGCWDDRDQPPRLSLAARNRIEGQRFLAANAQKPGVVVTASGLQYRVIQSGQGASPKLGEDIVLHYRGTLIDGREFETSRDRGEAPARMTLGRDVIRGWREGLQLMRPGAIYEFAIPSHLAYGLQGTLERDSSTPQKIGPNTTLMFVIELLSVER